MKQIDLVLMKIEKDLVGKLETGRVFLSVDFEIDPNLLGLDFFSNPFDIATLFAVGNADFVQNQLFDQVIDVFRPIQVDRFIGELIQRLLKVFGPDSHRAFQLFRFRIVFDFRDTDVKRVKTIECQNQENHFSRSLKGAIEIVRRTREPKIQFRLWLEFAKLKTVAE